MTGVRFTRRALGIAALAATSALVLSGCGPSASSSGPGELSTEPVTLTMSFWGNDVRQGNTQKIIDAFEKAHPNISIEPSYSDWGGYWDKLATETAANNTPDIIQMDEKYISTYADRGALLDLSTLGDSLKTGDFPQSAVDSGKVGDGLYGLSAGVTAYSMMANPAIFKEAGVAIPDDKTWTWEDFEKITAKISAAGGGKFYGTQAWGFEDGGLRLWARQNDDRLYDKDGKVVIKQETVKTWWDQLKKLTDEGSAPPAAASIEKQGGGLSESFTATNQAALGNWWNSQVTALSKASGQQLQVLRLPQSSNGEYWYKPSMYWSASSRTEHSAEVALFLDFLVNGEEAADIQLTERGVPANEKIRAHIASKVSDTDKAAIQFLDDLSGDVGEAETVTPPGGSGIEALLKKYTEQVLFGQVSSDEAAKAFIKELTADVQNAG
ncbi:ABC transporter substrate-binding protein [[Micrococcus luteus] ATCC 49442]|uniref:ABC transporter substrate-binding protein n=1 Tax=[Micrococcus luteus] ATCC 49442 TaxID=2698727 RepID=UPI0013DAA38A|nr:extracellular solute-binding protein [[Micrococcus luteus] ATCC 49442]